MSVDDRLREELGALLDGELPPEREAELRARLEREPELALELDALRRTVAAVRGLGRETAPPALRERLARPHAAPVRRARAVWPRLWLASAAVLLVAVGAALLAQLGDEPRRPPHEYEATLPEDEAPPAAKAEKAGDDAAEQIAALEEAPALREARDDEAKDGATEEAAPVRKLGADQRGRAQRPPADGEAEAEALDRGEGTRGVAEPEPDEVPAERPPAKADTTGRRDAADSDSESDKKEARRAVLSALARDGRLAPERRLEYLVTLSTLDPARIRGHVADLPEIRVPPTAPTTPKGPAPAAPSNEKTRAKAADAAESFGAKGDAPPALEVRMADRAEAEALVRLLRAAYPAAKKKSARGASTSFEVRRDGGLDLVVELTAREREQVRNWLDLIDVTRPPGKPAAIVQRREAPRADAGGAAEERAERDPVRVRILYAK
jgi:hypothetical protein